MTDMVYTGKYVQLTREALVQAVANQMSDKRLQHVLRVEAMALQLARIYGGDLEQVSVAALVHDYAKEREDEAFLTLIDEGDYPDDLCQFGNAIWHGLVGADMIQRELGIDDAAILQAVRVHTTGSANMSLLDKIIYVADYVEIGRTFPIVEEARKIAFQDIDEAVAFETLHTLSYLIEKKTLIYPKTIETYNHWVVQK